MASRPGPLAEAAQLRSQARRGILSSGLCLVILVAVATPVWSSFWLTTVRIVGMIGLGLWCMVSLARYQTYNRRVIIIDPQLSYECCRMHAAAPTTSRRSTKPSTTACGSHVPAPSWRPGSASRLAEPTT